MARVISVRPSGVVLTMIDDMEGVEASFPSGAEAEQAARRRLIDLANSGEPAELRIYLRDGSLAGRFISPKRALEFA